MRKKLQKQSSADILQNRCSKTFRNSQKKTPVLKSVFNLQIWRLANLLRRDSNTGVMRSSLSQIFFKIGVLKNFANFLGKYLWWSLFLIKLQAWRPATLFRRDCNTGVFHWNLRNFQEHLFYRRPLVATFETKHML